MFVGALPKVGSFCFCKPSIWVVTLMTCVFFGGNSDKQHNPSLHQGSICVDYYAVMLRMILTLMLTILMINVH